MIEINDDIKNIAKELEFNLLFKLPENNQKNFFKYCIYLFEINKFVCFGHKHYQDYTLHKDQTRKNYYIGRHKKNEKWGYDGRFTAGFWARWILWNKKTIHASIMDIEKKFNIKVLPANFK